MATLKFGLLGTGYFGRHYIRLIPKMQGAQLVSIAARTKETLNQVRVPNSILKTTDTSKIFNDPNIDCVVIATPPSTHFSLAVEAVEAGKHILLEKPMTTSLEDAKLLKELVKKEKITFMVGHQYLYNDHIRYLANKVKNNSLGQIKYILAEHFYPGPIRKDIGCLWDAGTHQLAILQYLFGQIKIKAVTGNKLSMMYGSHEDFVNITLKLQNGVMATVILSRFMPQKIRRLTVVGDKKIATYDDTMNREKLKFFSYTYPKKLRSYSAFFKSPIEYFTPIINAKEPLQNELEHFIYCVKNGRRPLTDVNHGYTITEFLQTISKTLDTKFN